VEDSLTDALDGEGDDWSSRAGGGGGGGGVGVVGRDMVYLTELILSPKGDTLLLFLFTAS